MTESLQRIRRTSAFMAMGCTTLIALIVAICIALWCAPEQWLADVLAARGLVLVPGALDLGSRAGGLAITLLPAGVAVYGLVQLRALFGLYRGGRVFDAAAGLRLRRFALALFGHALATPVTSAALSVWLTRFNPPGERQLMLSFGSADLYALFLGGVFVVIASVMCAARDVAEDNAAIV